MNLLSIQSRVAYGHVGNAAAVFPLQRLGHDVWPIDTVGFSNHLGYPTWRGRTHTVAEVREILDGLDLLGALKSCDAVLSGYLGDKGNGEVVLEAAALALDFLHGADSELAQDGNGRAPTLQGMLQEERLHDEWQQKPAAVGRQAEREAEQRERRGHRFDVALDVPFFVQFAHPALNRVPAGGRDAAHALLGLSPDASIDLWIGVFADAIGVGSDHVGTPLWRAFLTAQGAFRPRRTHAPYNLLSNHG